jgi:hypothetical protein
MHMLTHVHNTRHGTARHGTARAGWELLGLSRAENEQEEPSIICLRQAVKLEPTRATAYQALAVSYTNELRYDNILPRDTVLLARLSSPRDTRSSPRETILPSVSSVLKALKGQRQGFP